MPRRFPLINGSAMYQRWLGALAGLLLIVAAGSGCRHMYGNPFVDPLPDQTEVSTASSRRVAMMESERLTSTRDQERISTNSADGAVEHGPLYFEDPLLAGGSNNGRFAWTWEDYVGILYGGGRFLFNATVIPVSTVSSAPWTMARSTGFPDVRVAGE